MSSALNLTPKITIPKASKVCFVRLVTSENFSWSSFIKKTKRVFGFSAFVVVAFI